MDPRHKKPATLSHYGALVLDALQRIVLSLDDALDLDDLAAPACMAPLHFHRVFRGLLGETPLQLHRRLRLERAAWCLADHNDTVLRIALQAGYDTHEAFTRAFRDAFGRSPTEHRMRAEAEAGSPRWSPAQRAQFNQIQAACGLHAQGASVKLPGDLASLLQPHGALNMNVDIHTHAALRVAALEHIGPYNTIGAAFDRLGGIAGPAGLFSHPAAQMVAIYFDDPDAVPAGQLRSAAGVIVPDGVALPAGLQEVVLPGGRWASTLHRGSYGGLGDAWQRFVGQWLPGSGHQIRKAECYELYLNHPGNAREPDLETRLCMPLAD